MGEERYEVKFWIADWKDLEVEMWVGGGSTGPGKGQYEAVNGTSRERSTRCSIVVRGMGQLKSVLYARVLKYCCSSRHRAMWMFSRGTAANWRCDMFSWNGSCMQPNISLCAAIGYERTQNNAHSAAETAGPHSVTLTSGCHLKLILVALQLVVA